MASPGWVDDKNRRREEPITADWWFTHTAYGALRSLLPDIDSDASRFVMRLRRATGITAGYLRGKASDTRLISAAGQRILLTLLISGPLTQSQIASLSGMSRAAVSSAVRTLVVDGMVERTPSLEDRRAIFHSISDSGREEYLRIFKERNARERELLSALSLDEQNQFLKILEKLVVFASAHADADQLLTHDLLPLEGADPPKAG